MQCEKEHWATYSRPPAASHLMQNKERPPVDSEEPNKINVLVVDGNQDFTKNLVTYLSKKGYIPTAACTGHDAMEALKIKSYQVAILDLKLPDIDGITLLETIKTEHEHIIVILISGYVTIDAAAKAIKRGACDFIGKPFEDAELDLILQRALEKKEMTAKLIRANIRNIILALSLPLWALLGYYLVSLF
jgi:DNA-binding NtrC family response regulator